MTEDRAPARRPDEDRPDPVEQTAIVDGNDNITVLAGGDAHVTVQQPAAAGTEFVKYLAPSLLAALLVSILGEQLGIGGKIVTALTVAAWMTWSVARDTTLRLVQRFALPVVATTYTVAITTFTALPNIPKTLEFAVPAICWVAAAVITVRLTETERRHRTLTQYMGTTLIGTGVAMIGLGVGVVLDGHTLFGVAGIVLSVAVIGFGVAAVIDGDTLGNAAGIVAGVSMIGIGVAVILYGHTLFGVIGIFAGVALIGGGVASFSGRDDLEQFAAIGFGVAAIGFGVAAVLDGDALFGLAMIGLGTAMIGLGGGLIFGRDGLKQFAVICGGVAAIVRGVDTVLDGRALFGAAIVGFGVAAIGFGVALRSAE
ncbi:hypothetical protein ACFU44_27325 [Nocardia rhizosphaerihabitans]|uniref:hypothetical protein n=1 Tax=Nocardia rhizosphaerihabitans TaxID=1691570 RepID=UPI003671A3E0